MVGIILATHGGFADGIMQSGSMIFGDQPDVAAVTLQPSEGPNDIRKKMEDAIASFESQDEVLFLVDLWGGTPFNQANGLVSEHEDKWTIVAGLNLPMLIDAYGSRMTMETAHEVAVQIAGSGKEGVRIYPESLEPKEEPAAGQQAEAQPQGAIPEGTVLGDGHIKFVLARIDSRLLHGQVATAWTKTTQPNRIIVVSDSVAHSVGKVAVSKVVSLGKEDLKTFAKLKEHGIGFDVRKVPSDSKENMDEIIKKAEAELS